MQDGSSFQTDIAADPTNFEQGMNRAIKAVTDANSQISSQMGKVSEVFETLNKRAAIFSAIIMGGAGFKEAINTANQLNGEAMKLSKALGITGEAAAVLRTALGDIYIDSDTYVGAFQKFAGQIKKNEDGLNEMGLATRDANGNLRDSKELFGEALQMVGQYRPGLDQTTAAMTLFGKSVDDVMSLQKLNAKVVDEARDKNEALGMTLTKEALCRFEWNLTSENARGNAIVLA